MSAGMARLLTDLRTIDVEWGRAATLAYVEHLERFNRLPEGQLVHLIADAWRVV